MMGRLAKRGNGQQWRRDERGVALIEFAMVLPFLVLLFLGSYQLLDAVSAYRKVGRTVRTLSDLTTQNTSMTAAQADTILAASQQVMNPYSPANATMRISQIQINANATTGTVSWSRASTNGIALTTGSTVQIPPGLAFANNYYIFSEITYTYTPQMASSFIGTIPFTQTIYMSPRKSQYVAPQTGPLS